MAVIAGAVGILKEIINILKYKNYENENLQKKCKQDC